MRALGKSFPLGGDNPPLNRLHIWFHALFMINFLPVLVLRFSPLQD